MEKEGKDGVGSIHQPFTTWRATVGSLLVLEPTQDFKLQQYSLMYILSRIPDIFIYLFPSTFRKIQEEMPAGFLKPEQGIYCQCREEMNPSFLTFLLSEVTVPLYQWILYKTTNSTSLLRVGAIQSCYIWSCPEVNRKILLDEISNNMYQLGTLAIAFVKKKLLIFYYKIVSFLR